MSSSWWWDEFSKILIFTWKLKSYHCQQILSYCSPSSDRLTSFIFKKMTVKYPSLNNHILFITCSLKWKQCSTEKRRFSLQLQQSHTAFAQDNQCIQVCSRSHVCVFFPSGPTEYLGLVLQDCDLIKWIIFTVPSAFLSEPGF